MSEEKCRLCHGDSWFLEDSTPVRCPLCTDAEIATLRAQLTSALELLKVKDEALNVHRESALRSWGDEMLRLHERDCMFCKALAAKMPEATPATEKEK